MWCGAHVPFRVWLWFVTARVVPAGQTERVRQRAIAWWTPIQNAFNQLIDPSERCLYDCRERDLYAVLHVSPNARFDQIKRVYHKEALKSHRT